MDSNEILTILRNKYIFATLEGYKNFKSSDSSYNSKIINSKKTALRTFFDRKNKIKQDRELKSYKQKLEEIIKDNNLKTEFNQYKTTMESIDLKDIANQIQQAFSSIEVDEENSNNSKKVTSYEDVKAEFEKILKIRERIYDINSIKGEKVKKLNECTKALNDCFNEMLSLLKLKASSGNRYILFKENYKKIDKRMKISIYKKLSILRTIVLGQTVTEFIGESGEVTALFAAIGQTKANSVLNNALNDALQKIENSDNFAMDGEVVGKNTSTVKKILTPFGDSIELKVSSLISEVGTQDKTDVTLTFNEGKPMNLSVKSSAQSKTAPVHLQSVNLYENLYNVDKRGEFLTHYSNFLLYDDSDDLGNIKFQDLLKRHLAFEAISSGNLFKKGASWADTFVYINWETGKVYVNYINDILNEIDNFSYSSEINEIKNVLENSNTIDESDLTFPYFKRHKRIYEGLLKQTIGVELKTSKLKKLTK